MSYVFGGLIFKNGSSIDDNSILNLIGRQSSNRKAVINMEDATSSDFDGVGIARLRELLMVFGIDIPHSCSFENEPLSVVDRDLEKLSNNGDILCISVNGRMDTYAFSIYSKGKRIRSRMVAEGKDVSNIGSPTSFEKLVKPNESGMKKLVENFTGSGYEELIYEMNIPVEAFFE